MKLKSKAVNSEAEWEDISRPLDGACKNGILNQINETWLKAAPKDAKRDAGQCVNQLKAKVEQTVDATSDRILREVHSKGQPVGRAKVRDSAFQAGSGAESGGDRIDITLPGIRRPLGAEHPVIKTMNEMVGSVSQSRVFG